MYCILYIIDYRIHITYCIVHMIYYICVYFTLLYIYIIDYMLYIYIYTVLGLRVRGLGFKGIGFRVGGLGADFAGTAELPAPRSQLGSSQLFSPPRCRVRELSCSEKDGVSGRPEQLFLRSE